MKLKTKFTEGKWMYAPTGEKMQGYSQPFAVAAIFEDGTSTLVAGTFGDVRGGQEVAEANARLLAKAPEMYAALESAITSVTTLSPYLTGGHRKNMRALVDMIEPILKEARGK